jgi:hypothetical protein
VGNYNFPIFSRAKWGIHFLLCNYKVRPILFFFIRLNGISESIHVLLNATPSLCSFVISMVSVLASLNRGVPIVVPFCINEPRKMHSASFAANPRRHIFRAVYKTRYKSAKSASIVEELKGHSALYVYINSRFCLRRIQMWCRNWFV